MSRIFEDVKIKWDGQEYSIKSEKVLQAIAIIEEHITFSEIGEASQKKGGVSLVKIAQAYGSVLRFAGADVTDEAVYEGLFGNKNMSGNIQSVLNGLLAMMIPPSVLRETAKSVLSGEADSKSAGKTGAPAPGKSPEILAGVARSSGRRTRRRSATG